MTGTRAIAAVVPARDPRPLVVCRAHAPLCPRCGAQLRGVHIDAGSVFARCDAILPRTQWRDPATCEICSTPLHILGVGHGICLVVQLTDDEHAYLTQRSRDVLELYDYLGVLATRAGVREQRG